MSYDGAHRALNSTGTPSTQALRASGASELSTRGCRTLTCRARNLTLIARVRAIDGAPLLEWPWAQELQLSLGVRWWRPEPL